MIGFTEEHTYLCGSTSVFLVATTTYLCGGGGCWHGATKTSLTFNSPLDNAEMGETTMTTLNTINSLHETYCILSGRQLRMDIHGYMESVWFNWMREFNEHDLRMVLLHLVKEVNLGRRNPGCLKFDNLILDTPKFAQELAEVRAIVRNKRVETPRQRVLAQTGRTEPEKDNVKTAAQVMAGNAALQELLRLRDSL